jgi:hypothetical protein
VLRYINTCVLPFEEFSEDYVFDAKAESLSTLQTVVGERMTWKLLPNEGKRLCVRKKQGEKERNR